MKFIPSLSFVQTHVGIHSFLSIVLVVSFTINMYFLSKMDDPIFFGPVKIKKQRCTGRTKIVKQPKFKPKIVSMHYSNPWDRHGIEHNCILAQEAGFTMNVFTENLEYDYCKLCKCSRLDLINCNAPDPSEGAPNLCEKMNFVSKTVEKLKEVIFLDADLIVLDKTFFERFAARAAFHDFLATYAEGSYNEPFKYRNTFNSGMMFIRSIPEANYSDLLPMMYRYNSGCDQYMLSEYIHMTYKNWDSLSWKWHCRGLKQYNMDIPIEDCITLHQRGAEGFAILDKLNYTLRTI